jgi:hypothetical protein
MNRHAGNTMAAAMKALIARDSLEAVIVISPVGS